jgi:hypothetical protein
MRSFSSLFLSSALALTAIAAAASPAVAAGAYYRAELATPPAAERLVVRGVIWKCAADGCTAGPSNSRAVIDCSALARQVGTLRSFAVEGRALAPAELEKCNARAR